VTFALTFLNAMLCNLVNFYQLYRGAW